MWMPQDTGFTGKLIHTYMFLIPPFILLYSLSHSCTRTLNMGIGLGAFQVRVCSSSIMYILAE